MRISRIIAAREKRSACDWEAWVECQVGRLEERAEGGGVIREEFVDEDEVEEVIDGVGMRFRGLLAQRGLRCLGELVEVEFVEV